MPPNLERAETSTPFDGGLRRALLAAAVAAIVHLGLLAGLSVRSRTSAPPMQPLGTAVVAVESLEWAVDVTVQDSRPADLAPAGRKLAAQPDIARAPGESLTSDTRAPSHVGVTEPPSATEAPAHVPDMAA